MKFCGVRNKMNCSRRPIKVWADRIFAEKVLNAEEMWSHIRFLALFWLLLSKCFAGINLDFLAGNSREAIVWLGTFRGVEITSRRWEKLARTMVLKTVTLSGPISKGRRVNSYRRGFFSFTQKQKIMSLMSHKIKKEYQANANIVILDWFDIKHAWQAQ